MGLGFCLNLRPLLEVMGRKVCSVFLAQWTEIAGNCSASMGTCGDSEPAQGGCYGGISHRVAILFSFMAPARTSFLRVS